MKFKFLNIGIELPDSMTFDDALAVENKAKALLADLGFPATIGFDVQDDVNKPEKAVKAAPAAAPAPEPAPDAAPTTTA